MSRNYEYIIRVDGKEVWHGKDPKNKLLELKKKDQKKEFLLHGHLMMI